MLLSPPEGYFPLLRDLQLVVTVPARSTEILDIRPELPPRLRAQADSLLHAHEALLGWFEPDLDPQLNFTEGLVLLTDTRVVTTSGGGNQTAFRSCFLQIHGCAVRTEQSSFSHADVGPGKLNPLLMRRLGE